MGTELRSIDWGNHLGLNLTYSRIYFEKKAYRIFSSSSFHPGLALFHEHTFGGFGFSHTINFRWQSKKRSFVEFDLGARYNICPAYKNYGNNSQFELPLAIRWGMQLGKGIN